MLIILFAAVKFGVFSQEYLTESVWGRISQVFNFLGGNSRDIDTYMQRRVQLEFLLGKVSQEVFFGYGFSDVSLNYYDTDLGFINTILMFGIFGFSLFLLLFFSYFKMMLSALSKTFSNKDSRDAIRVLIVSFLGILIFYCTTFDFFSFYQADRVAFVMIFLVISGIFAREATREIASKGDSYDKHSSGF
jgi:hypothetical protein